MGHCFELEVVAGVVFEEHCPLLSFLALESEMRLHYELDLPFHFLLQLMELMDCEYDAIMRHRHIIQIDMIAMLLGLILGLHLEECH